MIELTEPQVWVLVGVFSASIIGMLSWQTILLNRTLETAIGSVRGEIDSVRREMEFFRESIDAKFEVVNHKIDALDRDVQALMRNAFGTDPR